MKSFALWIGSLSFFLFCAVGWGKDWRPYQATKSGDIYSYDPESIEKLPDSRVKIWVRTEKTEFKGGNLKDHVDEIIGGKKDKVTGEIIQLIEIDCSSNRYRIVNLAVYDKNKDIKEYYSDPSEWESIVSESVTHYLYKEICKE